jgi:hypothetical protein
VLYYIQQIHLEEILMGNININPGELVEQAKSCAWGLIQQAEAYLEGVIGTDINGEFLGLCGLGLVVLVLTIALGRSVIDKIFFNY